MVVYYCLLVITSIAMHCFHVLLMFLQGLVTCSNLAGTSSGSDQSRQSSPHGSGPSGNSLKNTLVITRVLHV